MRLQYSIHYKKNEYFATEPRTKFPLQFNFYNRITTILISLQYAFLHVSLQGFFIPLHNCNGNMPPFIFHCRQASEILLVFPFLIYKHKCTATLTKNDSCIVGETNSLQVIKYILIKNIKYD